MTYGIKALDASGALLFDSTATVAKYITTISVAAGGSGSYTDATYSEIYGICILTGANSSLLGNFGTIVVSSGNTVSWSSRYGARVDGSAGNISAACSVVIFAKI